MSYYYILFYPALLYKKFPPQIWRLVTSFWLTGPQLSILFDPYFLWTYGSALETESPRFSRKGDFFFYVAFIHLAVLVRKSEVNKITISLLSLQHYIEPRHICPASLL